MSVRSSDVPPLRVAAKSISRRRLLGRALAGGVGGVLMHFLPGSPLTKPAEAANCAEGLCFFWGSAAFCSDCSCSGCSGCGIDIWSYLGCPSYPDWVTVWWACCCWANQCAPCDGRFLGSGYNCG